MLLIKLLQKYNFSVDKTNISMRKLLFTDTIHTTGSLYTALGKQGELRNLRRYEEHSRAVLTSSDAGATADARCAVHSLVGILLGDEDSVGILSLTRRLLLGVKDYAHRQQNCGENNLFH